MKTNAIIRIALCTLGILVLTSALLIGLGVWNYGFSHETGGNFHSSGVSHASGVVDSQAFTADPAQIHNINIQWAAGNITIQPSDQVTDIRIAESAGDDQMVCKISGSTLTIQYGKSPNQFISMGTTTVAKDLVITVPSGWVCREMEIETAAANVDIKNMTIGELDFDGASGLCSLENCRITALDVDVASGDLTYSGVLDSLDFDGASADCTLILTECPSQIDLDGMSGKLDIALPSDCGFTVSTEGLSSDFSSDFQTTYRSGCHYYGDGSCKIEVDAMSGSVTIHDGGTNCSSDHSSGSHHSSHHK